MTPAPAQEPWRAAEPQWIEVDGGRVPLWSAGAGPPVLFVHGISADHTEWSAVAGALAADHRVLLPDLLGRGASRPEDDAGFTLPDEVDRLELLVEAAGVRLPFVAGHSHGASIALALSLRRPVAGLLLVSPVTPWTRRPAALRLLRSPLLRRATQPVLRACRRPLTRYILTRRVYAKRPPRLEDAVERYSAPYDDFDRARALLRIFRDWRPSDLAGLDAPAGVAVRVVTGGADARIPARQVQRWAERLGAPCTVVPGAGHGITEEEPGRVAEILREMAATDERARGRTEGTEKGPAGG